MAIAPPPNGLDGGADRSRFAAVLVDYNLRLDAEGVKAGAQKIHFRFDGGEIVLCAPLQNEACAQRRQAWHLGDIQKNIPRQHGRQAGQNFFRPPALALEVDDVGLQKHSAAVAEHRHGGGGESHIRIVLDRDAKSFRRGLQEIAVAGGALCVELEVFDAAILEDDELDVLSADIDDDVRIITEAQRRLGVRHGFNQGDVGRQHALQNVLGVAGRAHAEDFQMRALRFNLLAQILEEVDRVLDRVALGELVGFREHLAVLR